MATLYEINSAILDCVDLETGEVIDGRNSRNYSLLLMIKWKELLAGLKTFYPMRKR